ncbi:AMP-binding enzyme [Hirsutella rhossiliensis]|uniref:AMP-binding enzyme domain-containing protein n=1 Tax=Hirsutella rhossiliensis TaxID=111463 RepID=A0A9P8N8J1_9HYPO|nr:AMP-binding enzyme domain-containing protein [Hirsutella rhossiliensis]KAH0967946.1 AMP-binding enzyme domain-containing protein [Hirsutella rhossiliensis]
MSLYQDDMCLLSGPPSNSKEPVPSSAHREMSIPRSVYPLTKSQEGMWIEFQMSPAGTQYNLTLEWDLLSRGSNVAPPSITDILQVIHKLTARHAVLRSKIAVVDGKPHLEEYAAEDVDPEVRIVYRETSPIAEHAMTRILRTPFALQHQLPARWVILQDPRAFRVYIVGHHIVVDGQSMTNLSREFLELLEDPDAVLPPAVQFNAMHMAERAWARSQAYLDNQKVLMDQVRDQSNTPWSKEVSKPSTTNASYRKIDSWCTFPKSELDVWSQMFKTSWFRVATALVGLLVVDKKRPQFRKDEMLAVGFGSRPREMGACVGQFANALPVRVPLWKALDESDGSFRALVAAVGKNVSAVKKAELFPAVEVARSCRGLNIDYEPPRVAVTYSPKLARSECRLFPVEGSWDLFFCFLEYDTDVKLGVIYNPQVFSGAALNGMKTQFDRMVSLSKVDGAQLAEMLDWLPKHPCLPVAPADPQPNPLCHVHHWFDAHAESNPSSPALHSAEMGKSMTYGELYKSSEDKARFLRMRNVCRGDRVLIHLGRGFAIIEWILAILKCGAAFVYLDIDFTERQRASILENSKSILVVDEALVQELAQTHNASTASSLDEVKYATADDDLAYMIYTSGSTGEPKGVMVEHGNLAALVQASTNMFQVGFGTRVLQLASFTFDASILEWSSALCTGACLCFAQYPKQLVGEYLAEVIEKNGVTFMQITPTALETLPLEAEVPSLQQISIGGEAPSHEIFARWHPRVNLVNAYGPTEAAIAVAFNKIDKTDDLPDVVSAGPPNSKTTAHVCAEGFGAVLGTGVEGEICLSGPQISRGYCEKPDLTAKSFAVHHETGERMYRTGDKGLLLEDGSLLIMGRIDRELKVRGFRIAPEEIENAILSAGAGVQETSVQPSENGLEMLAFVAPSTVSPKILTDALKGILPSYKVPSKVHPVDTLPKNTNGKIDHKAVRSRRSELTRCSAPEGVEFLDSSDAETELSGDDQSADNETAVARIWQGILQMSSSPPVDVNFFDIGGHSLLVPKLHEKLKATFPSKAVRLVDLFHKSTIKSQAVLLSDGKKRPMPVRRRGPKPAVTKTPASLSSSVSTIDETPIFTRTAATSVSDVPNMPEIAVVGLAGRFPGAKNVDEFYSMLMNGQSGIRDSQTCAERETLPGNVWVPRAGALDDIEDFDHEFWNLGEEEATEMDPQQRLFLEVAFEALADAGIDGRSMAGERLGVFVGSANHAYHLHTESVVTDTFMRENRAFVAPSISTRTAYHLNARGPNVTIQTNCASSTVALSQAFDAIRLGRCDMALVGGVSVQLYDGGYITQKGQIFSSRGECHPFDSRADGTVPADAVTAVILKRYSAAISDETPVYAKILGTGIGADGALDKAGFQVPSPRGQADVIKSAWKVAELTADKLKYAEIHGSGTPIGDALELEGLSLAVKELGGGGRQFTVGSTKGNIGNAQHSSGLVSLIKLCKSMQAGVVPATKGLEQANPMINPDLPVVLASKQTRLDPDDILAVSAAGWGGVNSHVVLGFPDQRLRKETTTLVPETTFKRKALRAPRLRSSKLGGKRETSASLASLVFSKCASDVLGIRVDSDTDLKQNGLDSKSYTALVGAASKRLPGPSVGVKGMLLGVCTPSALAAIYEDQLRGAKPHGVTSTILQVGKDATIILLPGSGGSCAAAHPLVGCLPEGLTIMALEHPEEDPTMGHVNAYLEPARACAESRRLIIVGISLGGLSALGLAALIGEQRPELDISLIALDSPPIDTWPELEKTSRAALARVKHATYVGAAAGQSGTCPLVKKQWEAVIPGVAMHELDCGHFDVWGTSQAGQTAAIVDTVVRKMMQ